MPSETPANLFNWEQQSCKETLALVDFNLVKFPELKALKTFV